MRYLQDLDKLIAKAIQSNAQRTVPLFIALIIIFTVISVIEMINIGETPDFSNPGVVLIIIATELFCYLAIWTYIKKILSRRPYESAD